MWTNYAYTENNLQKSHSEAEKAMDGGRVMSTNDRRIWIVTSY